MTQDALIPEPQPRPSTPNPNNATVSKLPWKRPYGWARPAGWRSATHHKCPHCKQPTLTGPNDDQCAFQATADPTPLTPLGEALTLLAGHRTYTLTRCGTAGIALTRRDATTITNQPAGQGRRDILPAHHCHTPPLPPEAYTTSNLTPVKQQPDRNTPPPF